MPTDRYLFKTLARFPEVVKRASVVVVCKCIESGFMLLDSGRRTPLVTMDAHLASDGASHPWRCDP